jgi:hypothetical protein
MKTLLVAVAVIAVAGTAAYGPQQQNPSRPFRQCVSAGAAVQNP